MEQFLKDVKELRKIEDQKGTNLRSMRLFVAQVGGQNTGQVSLVFEYDDLASWGATVDAEVASDPWFLAVPGPDDTFELIGQTLYLEIPY